MNSERVRAWQRLSRLSESHGLELDGLGRLLAAGTAEKLVAVTHDVRALVADWAEGIFDCPSCDSRFAEWPALRAHVRPYGPVGRPTCTPAPTVAELVSAVTREAPPVPRAEGWATPTESTLIASPGLRVGRSPRGTAVLYVPTERLDRRAFVEDCLDAWDDAGGYEDDVVVTDERPRLERGELRHAAAIFRLRRAAPGYPQLLNPRGFPMWVAEASWDARQKLRLSINPKYTQLVPRST